MIEVRLNFNTIDEAVAFLAGKPVTPSATITPEKQQAARESTAAGKTEKAAAAAIEKAKADTKPEVKTPPVEEAKGPDLTALRTEVSAKVVKLAGMDADASRALALMAGFGCKRAKELKDDQLDAALKAVDAALSAAEMA